MLEAHQLRKYYHTPAGIVRAVESISFNVAQGEFIAIVGPSGAGKSTVLRLLAGLGQTSSGEVRYHGQAIDGPPEDFAPVFQDYARSLFPWFSVARNVALPLVNKVADAGERKRIAEAALAQVGLPGFGEKQPTQLSGGQQQRVAIARALAYSPSVLIMDEPFASVDAQTRNELEDLVLSLRHQTAATVIFVTHDVDEAVYMSDRVIVLSRSPSVVLEDVRIDLPAQRDQLLTKALPAFASARAHILNLIRQASTPQGGEAQHA